MRAVSPTSALPSATAPFPDETIASFAPRLAATNHLPPPGLDPLLHDRPTVAGQLAVLTGRSAAVLAWSLPELRSAGDTAGAPLDLPTGYDQPPRLACVRCTARRGITGPVRRWAPGHLRVCVTHRRWIDASTGHVDEQVDLAAVPAVVAAAAHHRNLVRRHGQRRVGLAYTRAAHIIDRWTEQDIHERHRERRLRALGEARTTIALSDPVLRATNYPETVALTSVLASPFWLRMAASDEPRRRNAFFAEIARRLDIDYRADTLFDPIVHWTYRGGAHQHLRALTTTATAAQPDGGTHRHRNLAGGVR